MYSEGNILEQNKRLKKMLMRVLLSLLVPIAILVFGFMERVQPLAAAGCFLFFALLIFSWDFFLKPIYCYRLYIRDLIRGSSHETRGILVHQGSEDVREDGVDFREVILNIYRDLAEDGERRFLLDARKAPLPIKDGTAVILRSQGSFIMDACEIGETAYE